ncbi:hypothetical protein ACFYN0_26755 [Streptomyces sp. NPDC006704]|uniref:hypothetical protein n=1 Tax=Streptomyces sp. NPDC006704 TaxID=3364760 RepID=UPI0036C71DA6
MSEIKAAVAEVLEDLASGLEERVEHFSSTYSTSTEAIKAQVLSEVLDELRRVSTDLAA